MKDVPRKGGDECLRVEKMQVLVQDDLRVVAYKTPQSRGEENRCFHQKRDTNR